MVGEDQGLSVARHGSNGVTVCRWADHDGGMVQVDRAWPRCGNVQVGYLDRRIVWMVDPRVQGNVNGARGRRVEIARIEECEDVLRRFLR